MASAAYLLAARMSGAGADLVATPRAMVGSIGTYGVVTDTSGLLAKLGVKKTLVSSGGVKGQGTPGIEISQAYLEDRQRQVQQTQGWFNQSVATGRKMELSRVTTLATGQIWRSEDTVGLGLIDEVMTVERVLGEMDRAAMEVPARAGR
jgi:protease-4